MSQVISDDVEEFTSVEQISARITELKAMVRERGIALAWALEALGGELRIEQPELVEYDYRGKEFQTFMDMESRAMVIRLRPRTAAKTLDGT